jgi:hypothetical protein
MNDKIAKDLEGIGRGLIEELYQNLLGSTKENHEKLYTRCPGRNSNPEPSENKSRVLVADRPDRSSDFILKIPKLCGERIKIRRFKPCEG